MGNTYTSPQRQLSLILRLTLSLISFYSMTSLIFNSNYIQPLMMTGSGTRSTGKKSNARSVSARYGLRSKSVSSTAFRLKGRDLFNTQ